MPISETLLSILSVATAAMVFASAFLTWRSRKHAQKAEKEVTEIHMIVNSQRDDMNAQIEQLKALIRGKGYVVPAPPSRKDADDAAREGEEQESDRQEHRTTSEGGTE